MTLNRHLTIVAAALAMGAAFTACDRDGDTIYTNGASSALIDGDTSDIVLDKDRLDALAMTIYWDANGDISLSDPLVAAPDNAVTNAIQFAADPDFNLMVEETVAPGTYERQLTCAQLNALVSRLGFAGGERHPLYIRVVSTIGPNIPAKYSDVLCINVTPYFIDMTVGFILDSAHADTGCTLASPAADGVYTGFIGASGWFNWYLLEGNGTEWGNDAVTGTAFVLGNSTTGEEYWNMWFPEAAGCYYTIVDTKNNEWSALLIPELTVSGDISGTMTYDRKTNTWTMPFTAAAAGTVNVTVSGLAAQYNVSTGTDAVTPGEPVGFGGDASALSFGQAAAVAVTVAAAGDNTLYLNLSDPKAWTLTAEGGAPAPVEEVAEYIYLPGIVDPWGFDDALKLYDEDTRSYGGVHYIDSEWGYQIAVEKDNWTDVYHMADGGNAFEGSLIFQGANNITAPEPGIYLMNVSIGNLTYRLNRVDKVAYSGLNDDWSLTEMTPGDTPGVYTATVTKSANTPWGVKIIINDNWDLFFGGNGRPGELVLNHDGFEGDNDLANGTYTLTVDLAHGTYTYE